MNGYVQTVLGRVDPGAVGVTMMHEHILATAPHIAIPPEEPGARALFEAPLDFEVLRAIRFGGRANRANCGLEDETLAADELARYAAAGGRTVVDATSRGIGRDPDGLARVARATGLNIVMGSSWYVASTHPREDDVAGASEDELAARIVAEFADGVGGNGIRPGLIGEVGCSWPLEDVERKVLRASAKAQRETGAALSIHPGRDRRAPFEIVEILDAAGADLTRTVMCHVDRTIGDRESLRRLAATGIVIEFDLFGYEGSYYAWELPVDMPNDSRRVRMLAWLAGEGFVGSLVVSHDVYFKDKLARWGGQGYSHIVENVVPLMRRRGLSEATIDAMLVSTPRRLLTLGAS
ncbi:MAG: aryldialkylphosphatase [Alphaproteobacteria bacterium]|nr:aryldialkylphosphatase [Alphaproteobacteria bacterium]